MVNAEIYYHTNENLESAIKVIEPKSGDRILAVCGSGDHAFALTENASKVVAAEIDHNQFAYVTKRRDALVRGDYEGFAVRSKYFTREKFEAIRSNTSSLSLVHGDVFDIDGEFNKVYLSNALDWVYRDKGSEGVKSALNRLAKKLPFNGLVYLTKGPEDRRLSGLITPEFVIDPFALNVLNKPRERDHKDWEWDSMVLRKKRRKRNESF